MPWQYRGESAMSNEQVAPETKGVTVKVLATVDLGPEIEGMAGRQLREDRNTTHWLENRGTIPAMGISVDVVRQKLARVRRPTPPGTVRGSTGRAWVGFPFFFAPVSYNVERHAVEGGIDGTIEGRRSPL
jgi:hypothetical protein